MRTIAAGVTDSAFVTEYDSLVPFTVFGPLFLTTFSGGSGSGSLTFDAQLILNGTIVDYITVTQTPNSTGRFAKIGPRSVGEGTDNDLTMFSSTFDLPEMFSTHRLVIQTKVTANSRTASTTLSPKFYGHKTDTSQKIHEIIMFDSASGILLPSHGTYLDGPFIFNPVGGSYGPPYTGSGWVNFVVPPPNNPPNPPPPPWAIGPAVIFGMIVGRFGITFGAAYAHFELSVDDTGGFNYSSASFGANGLPGYTVCAFGALPNQFPQNTLGDSTTFAAMPYASQPPTIRFQSLLSFGVIVDSHGSGPTVEGSGSACLAYLDPNGPS